MSPHSPGSLDPDPSEAEIGHRAGSRDESERQARPHPRRGDQGLRRARLPQRDGGGDRPCRRGGGRHHLPVFQGKRRSAPAALRREDDRAARRGEGRHRAGADRAGQAQAVHPAPSRAGRAEPRPRLGAHRRAAAKRAVPEGGRPAEARGIRRPDRGGGAVRTGERGARSGYLAGDGEARGLWRPGRAGARVARGRPPRGAEEDRGRGRGMAGARAPAPRWRSVLKILVTVKRVEDYESKIKVKPDNSWIVTEGVNYRANPFDEIAVEESLRLRDANAPSEVVAVSIGGAAAQAEIRSALAMGADRGILVKHDGFLDSDAVARLLQKVIEKEKPELVLMGKQAVDVDDNVTGQLLAEYAGWGQATFASKKATLSALSAAQQLAQKNGGQIEAVVIGAGAGQSAQELAAFVSAVHTVEGAGFEHALAETHAAAAAEAAKKIGATDVLLAATAYGKDVAPRIAAKLGAGIASDILAVVSGSQFKRAMWAGNAIATVEVTTPVKVITVRATEFQVAKKGAAAGNVQQIAVR